MLQQLILRLVQLAGANAVTTDIAAGATADIAIADGADGATVAADAAVAAIAIGEVVSWRMCCNMVN